tara:strand:+ start:138 stop:467 length:330 start_codon:yes stop_codon:yes gene_type:complete
MKLFILLSELRNKHKKKHTIMKVYRLIFEKSTDHKGRHECLFKTKESAIDFIKCTLAKDMTSEKLQITKGGIPDFHHITYDGSPLRFHKTYRDTNVWCPISLTDTLIFQ